ncbi:ribonuclease Z [Candidatus Fermentibacteria bacterium]|nr:ribonuclease Z [Candidatus Fermentibacteria bacterium]
MQVVFLGTSSGMPTRQRNVASIAIRPSKCTEWLLIDCGEGTQHQILRNDAVRLGRIKKVFLTHLHADHILGLPGLVASRGLHSTHEAMRIFGPEGAGEFLTAVLALSHTHLPFPIEVQAVVPGLVHRAPAYSVFCALLEHRIPTFGYRIQEPDRPGTLDVAAARARGVPDGPLLGRLKRGETIVLDDGTEVRGGELCAPAQRGPSVAMCLDTMPCDAAVELAASADLLIHEATFAEEDRTRAPEHWHSTAVQAAQIALRAGVGRLILTHFSARYDAASGGTARHVAEARAIFPVTEAAEDFMAVQIEK